MRAKGESAYRDWGLDVSNFRHGAAAYDSLRLTHARNLDSGRNESQAGYKSPTSYTGQGFILFLRQRWDDAPGRADHGSTKETWSGGRSWVTINDNVEVRIDHVFTLIVPNGD